MAENEPDEVTDEADDEDVVTDDVGDDVAFVEAWEDRVPSVVIDEADVLWVIVVVDDEASSIVTIPVPGFDAAFEAVEDLASSVVIDGVPGDVAADEVWDDEPSLYPTEMVPDDVKCDAVDPGVDDMPGLILWVVDASWDVTRTFDDITDVVNSEEVASPAVTDDDEDKWVSFVKEVVKSLVLNELPAISNVSINTDVAEVVN